MVILHGTGSCQMRGGKGEAEVRPAGRSEDGNAGMAQEELMLELSIGSEAPERCYRRGSAPSYTSVTLTHHTHESGGAQGAEKPPPCQISAGQPLLGLQHRPAKISRVIMCLPMIFCTRWPLPCSLPRTPRCLCSERRASFPGGEHPAAGFCCGSSAPCSHEKGTRARGKLPCIIVPALLL